MPTYFWIFHCTLDTSRLTKIYEEIWYLFMPLKMSHIFKLCRVNSGNSEQKSAIFVLSALFYNHFQNCCFHLCISIFDFSIFTVVQKKKINEWINKSVRMDMSKITLERVILRFKGKSAKLILFDIRFPKILTRTIC